MASSKTAPDIEGRRPERPWDDEAINAIMERCKARRILNDRSDDEILGYDENGPPS